MILGTGVNVRCTGLWLALLLLLCLCVSSWGACRTANNQWKAWNSTGGCSTASEIYECSCLEFACSWSGINRTCYIKGSGSGHCVPPVVNDGNKFSWLPITYCDTQAEADSVACTQNPDLPNCAVTTDTLLFACSESIINGQAVSTIYRLSCKATNGQVTECNGKQDIDISTDGQPVKTMQGTCAQNGVNNGVFGGGTPQDSTNVPTANADCFAITGHTCHMKDKASGNTFTCDCDGNCNVALQNLMAGSANCTNPYPQPEDSNDSLNLNQSSPSSSPSSDSGGESSPSSGGSGQPGDSTGDFEYDYTLVLEAIRANTQYTGEQVNNLNYKADVANDYLSQIANKNWNPTINVGSPNVTLNADTAKAPKAILDLLNDKMSGGEPSSGDTAGTGAQISGYMSQIDSIVNEGVPDMSDSIGKGIQAMRGAYNALKDSLGNSAWSDSVAKWQNTLTNNGVLSGSGSDNCPAVLTKTWDVPIGSVNAKVGPLGKYLCSPIAGGLTGWALARILLRALVSIFCMVWLFKAVMGIDGGNNEED